MLCLILFNCHGSQIEFQLKQSCEFNNKYRTVHIDLNDYVPNGVFIKDKWDEEDLNLIKNTDY